MLAEDLNNELTVQSHFSVHSDFRALAGKYKETPNS